MYKFVTAVWGSEFIKLFLEIALPTQLTPENLPAFAARTSAVYFIYTKKSDSEIITNSNVYKRLLFYIEVRIVYIDDVVDKKILEKGTHYPMAACHRHFIHNERHDDSTLIFLSPDVICTDGSFIKVLEAAEKGNRLIAIIALRLNKDTLAPEFLEKFIKDGICSSIKPREFVKFCVNHLHPDTKALFLDSDMSNSYPAVLLWNIKDEGILIRSFHLHPLLVKPSADTKLPENTIDDDFVLSIPQKEVYIFDDSDDVCFFELSHSSYRSVCIRDYPQTTEYICGFIHGGTNFRHKEFVKTPIRLHYSDVTEKWLPIEKKADILIEEVMKYSKLLDKRLNCTDNYKIIENYIGKTWAYLGLRGQRDRNLKVAIYGAGLHTRWMDKILAVDDKSNGPEVVAILDDKPNESVSFFGKTPVNAETFDPSSVDAVIMSSDVKNKEMTKKCRDRWGDRVEIIDLYENFPPGPYLKRDVSKI